MKLGACHSAGKVHPIRSASIILRNGTLNYKLPTHRNVKSGADGRKINSGGIITISFDVVVVVVHRSSPPQEIGTFITWRVVIIYYSSTHISN